MSDYYSIKKQIDRWQYNLGWDWRDDHQRALEALGDIVAELAEENEVLRQKIAAASHPDPRLFGNT